MKVIGNGVQKELKFNLQHNTTLFKTYKILSSKLTTSFGLLIKVFPSPPQLLAEVRRIDNVLSGLNNFKLPDFIISTPQSQIWIMFVVTS